MSISGIRKYIEILMLLTLITEKTAERIDSHWLLEALLYKLPIYDQLYIAIGLNSP